MRKPKSQAQGETLGPLGEWYAENPQTRDVHGGNLILLRRIVQQSIQTVIHYLLHFYYVLKPALPSSVRMALRRYHAIPLKWSSAATWPINQAFIGRPPHWPGWP